MGFHQPSNLTKQPGQEKRIATTTVGLKLRSLSLILIHFLGLLVFSYGIAFSKNFHNGDECEMTYSMREFVEIATSFESISPVTNRYKLYKFYDRRDPRYQSLLRLQQPLSDHRDWCGTSNHAIVKLVLFIPGHWGSYTQSRSLGAHGVKLTGKVSGAAMESIVKALERGSLSGAATSEESFIYEVLAVDFAEQGAALHGDFLVSQSNYVSDSIQHISVSTEMYRNSLCKPYLIRRLSVLAMSNQ